MVIVIVLFFFFKQKTAYEMRISDWSSDVCSSDLTEAGPAGGKQLADDEGIARHDAALHQAEQRRDDVERRQPVEWQVAGQRNRLQYRAEQQGRQRSEERRVGKEWVRTCRSRWAPDQ